MLSKNRVRWIYLINGRSTSAEVLFSQSKHSLSIGGLTFQPNERLEVKLKTQPYRVDWRADVVRVMLRAFRLGSDTKNSINSRVDEMIATPELLEANLTGLPKSQIRAMIEVITNCGVEHIKNAGEELLIVWNRSGDEGFRFSVLSENTGSYNPKARFSIKEGAVTNSQIYRPAKDFPVPSILTVQYHDLLKIAFPFGVNEEK